jgi:prolipoprotein diacylglyceryl transferase
VPFGVVGGRIYHVITSPEAYFGATGDPVKALYIWQGGLGIWGAVVLGGVGAWIACRRAGIKLPAFADAIAPAILIAQAIGRWGNWFNNELYGKLTDLPWKLEIYEWDSSRGQAVVDAAGQPIVKGYFHPTFLYESIWDLGAAIVLIVIERRHKLGHGRVFAVYCMLYTLGRGWIEALRVDPAERVLGLRLNVWTSLVVFLGAGIYLIISNWFRPGRETEVHRRMTPSSDSQGADESASGPAEGAGDAQGTESKSPDGLDGTASPAPGSASDPPTELMPSGSGVTSSHDKDVTPATEPEHG